MSRTVKAPARKRRFPKYDEGFLVDYGCPRAKAGARRGRLTPNLAREYMRTHDAIATALVDRIEEAEEAAFVPCAPECWECGIDLDREGVCIDCQHEMAASFADYDRMGAHYSDYDWDAEEAAWAREEAEIARAYEVINLARAIVRTQLTRIEG